MFSNSPLHFCSCSDIVSFRLRSTINVVRCKLPIMLSMQSSFRSSVSHLVVGCVLTSSISLALAYDFVIIGGGTSGLVIANRLSDIPNITVAVIEAGFSVLNNTNVSRVDGFTLGLGTSIDWQYDTTSQTYADGRTFKYNAGKALGGTSTINGGYFIAEESRRCWAEDSRNDICTRRIATNWRMATTAW